MHLTENKCLHLKVKHSKINEIGRKYLQTGRPNFSAKDKVTSLSVKKKYHTMNKSIAAQKAENRYAINGTMLKICKRKENL